MKQTEFIEWLRGNNYDEGTIKSRVANCLRIEEFEGDLDCHYSRDKMDELLSCLKYSTENKRNNMPPNHSIPINGDIYNGLTGIYIMGPQLLDRLSIYT